MKSNSANTNYGQDLQLRVREGTLASPTTYHAYLKFDVNGVAGSVASVKLRLWIDDGTNDGGSVYPTGTSWTETGLTWNTAPALGGSPLASLGATTTGTWEEVELGPAAVSADGTYAFGLQSASTTSGYYSSREGAHPPELVITLGG